MSVLRVFFVDFNDPKLTALVPWYDDLPSVGEPVVLTDGECNFALGQVANADHTAGRIHCKANYAYAEQQTRGAVNVTVRFGTRECQRASL